MADVTQQQVVEYIKGITVLELSQLVKTLESELGVSAAMPMAMPGGGGGGAAAAAPTPTDISDGKIKGDEISFSVKREFNGNAMVMKYNGKVEGDKITGKIEMPGRNGGDPTSRDWTATREAAATEKAPEKK